MKRNILQLGLMISFLFANLSIGLARADSTPPPDTIVTESTFSEWVYPEGTENSEPVLGEGRLTEWTQTTSIDNGTESSIVITKWRALSTLKYWDNIFGWSFKVKAGAQTTTSDCVNEVKVKAYHDYQDSSGNWYTTTPNSGSDLIGCRDNTGKQWTNEQAFYAGTYHQARADHSAKINGVWYKYNGETCPCGKY